MKIVSEDVQPVTELRKSVPPHVAAATTKSLEKLAADRFGSAKEFADALTNPAFTLPTKQVAPVSVTASTAWNHLSMSLGAVAALMTVGALWGWLRPAAEKPVFPVRFVLTLPRDQSPGPGSGGVDVAFSPDGSRFVFQGVSGGVSQLFAHAIDEFESRPIPGTEGAGQPFFSHNGQWLGFVAQGQLKKVRVSGGPVLPIAEVQSLQGATWGANDVIVFGTFVLGVLMQVAAEGGTPERITALDTTVGETSHRYPEILPGGDAVVFTSWSGSNETARIAVASLASGRVTRLSEQGMNPHYTASGHLVYTRFDGSVVGVPFDIRGMTVTGPAIPLLDNVGVGDFGNSQLALSRTGSLVYRPGITSPDRTLVMVDRQGGEGPLTDERREFREPRFSPSGDRVAVTIGGHIWVYEIDQGTLAPLTFEGRNRYATWTPDGTRLTFSSIRGTSRALYTVLADGSSRAEPFLTSQNNILENVRSRDGQWLAFREVAPTTGHDIMVAPLEGEVGTPRPFAQTSSNERSLALAPNGRWLTYVSNQSGQDQVYVQAFPTPARLIQVSVDGGAHPMWAPDGTELFYRTGNKFMAAAIETDPIFRVTRRNVLFERDYYQFDQHYAHYDVHPRTRQFVMIKRAPEAGDAKIVVVTNWVEELKAKVGN